MNEKIIVEMGLVLVSIEKSALNMNKTPKALPCSFYFGTFWAPQVTKKVIEYYCRKKSEKARYLKVAGFALNGVLRINRFMKIR